MKIGTSRLTLVAVKPMGALGRVVIPGSVRRALGLRAGSGIGIYSDGEIVILRTFKSADRCPLCGHPMAAGGRKAQGG